MFPIKWAPQPESAAFAGLGWRRTIVNPNTRLNRTPPRSHEYTLTRCDIPHKSRFHWDIEGAGGDPTVDTLH